MMNVLKQGPAIEPVSAEDMQSYLRMDKRDRMFLESLITSARMLIETKTSLGLIRQSWEVLLDDWGGENISLPKNPTSAVVSIETLNADGVAKRVPSSLYCLEKRANPALIMLKPGKQWPALERKKLAILITIEVGFGNAPEDVPEPLRQAVRDLAGYWYEARDAIMQGQYVIEVPKHIDSRLAPYLVKHL